MTTVFNKTLATVDITQLQNEINSNVIFTATATAVDWSSPDSLMITFNTDLSGAEETELDVVIAAHVPDPVLVNVVTL